jgi:hypothetical protein
MSSPANTRNVYQCAECGEEYESCARREDYTKPVDRFFERPGQYGRERFYDAYYWWEPGAFGRRRKRIEAPAK